MSLKDKITQIAQQAAAAAFSQIGNNNTTNAAQVMTAQITKISSSTGSGRKADLVDFNGNPYSGITVSGTRNLGVGDTVELYVNQGICR